MNSTLKNNSKNDALGKEISYIATETTDYLIRL